MFFKTPPYLPKNAGILSPEYQLTAKELRIRVKESELVANVSRHIGYARKLDESTGKYR